MLDTSEGGQIAAEKPALAQALTIRFGGSKPATATGERSLLMRDRPNENLWDLAAAKLSPEDRGLVDFSNPDKTSLLRDLLTVTEQKKAICIEKRLKYTRKTGEVVILRDLFDKITTWLEKFMAIGDIIVQYDPGHAALPWACIRFILQLAVNDSHRFGAVLEGLELAAHVIAHNAIVEQLYMNRNLQIGGLQDALVKLYARVLLYLAEASRFYGKSNLRRLASSIVEFPGSFQKLTDDITSAQSEVDAFARLVDIECQRELGARLGSLSLESKRREVLKWISVTPYEQHHQNIRRDRLVDSGTWLFKKSEYKQWTKSSASSVLWLRGITGSGKTMLTSMLVDHLKGVSTSNEALAYFYCTRNPAEPERGDPSEILRSVVRQLSCLKPGFPIMEPILSKYSEREEDSFGFTKLTLGECLELIIELTEIYPSTTIVLDGLDECSPDTRHELLQALDDIIQKSAGLVKIFVSSRDDNDIVCRLKDSPNLYIQSSDNSEDIRRFVHQEVELSIRRRRLLSGDVSEDLRQTIVDSLVDGAQGMFRWVSLQLQTLCSSKILLEDDVREQLGNLPRGLADIYSMIYEQISGSGPRSRAVAVRALKWLLCGERSLLIDEFIAAVSVDSEGVHTKVSESQILDACCNLVVIDTELGVFRFAHLSVREYLESREEYTPAAAHALAAERCLVVCLANSRFNHSTEEASQANELFENYAVLHWAAHCQMSGELRREGRLGKLFREFTEDFDLIPSYDEWTHLAAAHLRLLSPLTYALETKVRQMTSSPADPIFAACVWGFSDVLQNSLSRKRMGLDKRNIDGETGLYLASRHGHHQIVRELVKRGADVEATGGYYGNALQASLVYSHEAVFQLLMDAGADVNAQAGICGNALQAASRYERPRIVQQLIGSGADINAQGGYWGNALQAASRTGSKAIVQILLDRGAVVNAQGGRCGTALQAASLGGHDEIVQLLLDRGADINSQGGKFGNALQAALVGTVVDAFSESVGRQASPSSTWNECIVERRFKLIHMLINRGANINAQGGYYGNALQASLARGLEGLAPMLLEKGADPNAQGGQFGNALQAAARYAGPDNVQQLLDYGADVNAQGGYYGNALQAASHRGDEKIVQMLIENGANANARGGHWDHALHAARGRGHERIVRILIDCDVKVED